MVTQRTLATPEKESKPVVKVSVHILRNPANGHYTITTTHPLGTTAAIITHLPPPLQPRVRNFVHESFEYAMASTYGTVSSLDWQNAAAAELVTRLSAPNDTHDATETALATNAFLALGDAIYKLQPIAVSPSNRILHSLRAKLRTEMTTERDRILAAATDNASRTLSTAALRLQEANDRLAEANRLAVPPTWCLRNRIAVYRRDEAWRIGINFNFLITHFEHHSKNPARNTLTIKRWPAILQRPIPILCWTPIHQDGSYSFSSIHLAASAPSLPHMTHSDACMGPATAPSTLNSMNDYNQLVDALARTMSVTVINSLLTPLSHWPSSILAFMPAPLATAFSSSESFDAFPCADTSTTTITADHAETWSAA